LLSIDHWGIDLGAFYWLVSGPYSAPTPVVVIKRVSLSTNCLVSVGQSVLTLQCKRFAGASSFFQDQAEICCPIQQNEAVTVSSDPLLEIIFRSGWHHHPLLETIFGSGWWHHLLLEMVLWEKFITVLYGLRWRQILYQNCIAQRDLKLCI
jgi:hypothetical protein